MKLNGPLPIRSFRRRKSARVAGRFSRRFSVNRPSRKMTGRIFCRISLRMGIRDRDPAKYSDKPKRQGRSSTVEIEKASKSSVTTLILSSYRMLVSVKIYRVALRSSLAFPMC